MAKPKVAFYWCSSCGGCEETVVDLNEDLLKIAEAVEIVLWPVALDFKRKDIEALGHEEIAVSFINGAVRLEEQEEMVKLLREKSKLVVAFGACAHLGGIPGLGNFCTRETVFERIYSEVPTVKIPVVQDRRRKQALKRASLPCLSSMIRLTHWTRPYR